MNEPYQQLAVRRIVKYLARNGIPYEPVKIVERNGKRYLILSLDLLICELWLYAAFGEELHYILKAAGEIICESRSQVELLKKMKSYRKYGIHNGYLDLCSQSCGKANG